MSGGSNTYSIIGMERFAEACEVTYDKGILSMRCDLQHPRTGRTLSFEKSVDIRPAIEFVHNKMVDWHRAQHGDAAVSGWTDFVKDAYHSAENAAKSVAHSKIAKALWKQVKAHQDDIEDAAASVIPGGSQALAVARKASKLYEDAKKNHPDAIAKVKQLVGMADQGDPKAAFAVKVMQQTAVITQAKAAGQPLPPVNDNASQEQPHRSSSLYDLGLAGVSGTSVGSWQSSQAQSMARQIAKRQQRGNRDHRSAAPGGRDHRSTGSRQVVNAPGTGRPARQFSPDFLAALQNQQQGLPPAPPPAPQEQQYADQGGGGGGGGDQGYDGQDDQGYDPSQDDQGYDPGYDQGYCDPNDPNCYQQQGYDCDPNDPNCYPQQQGYAQQPNVRDHRVAGNYDLSVDDDYEVDMDVDQNRGRYEVSGWMYNRPYRHTADAMTQLQKSPGVGFAVRELYNRGLGRGNTDLSDLAAAAINQL